MSKIRCGKNIFAIHVLYSHCDFVVNRKKINLTVQYKKKRNGGD